MPLPATIRCFYGGNSSPSSDFDQSIYGRTLTPTGTPNTPSTPTPPEGDQWLYFQTGPAGFWTGPVSAFPTGAFVGKIAWQQRYVVASGADIISRIRDAVSSRQFLIQTNSTNMTIAYNDSGGTARVFLFAHGMIAGTLYKWEVRVTAALVEVFKDGILMGSLAFGSDLGTPTEFFLGVGSIGGGSGNESYVDAFMVSDNPDEPYPSSGIPWANISRVRRR